MNVVLIKTGNSDIHTPRTPYIDKGRDRGDASTNQGMLNRQKLGERHGIDSPSQSSEGINLENTLVSNF